MKTRSTKNDILKAIIGAAIFISVLGGIFTYSLYKSRQDTNLNAALRAQAMARLLAFRISSLAESTKLWLDELERHIDPDLLVSGSLIPSDKLINLNKWVDDIKRQNSEIGNMGFLDVRGNAILTQSKTKKTVNLADTSYWKQIQANGAAGRGKIFLSEPYIFKTTKKLGIVFARGVYSNDGQILGAVVAGVHIVQLSEMLQLADTGKHGTAVLYDEKLKLLGRWPARDDIKSGLQLTPQNRPGPIDYTYIRVSEFDHIERMVATAQIKGLPLSVAVSLSRDEYFEAWKEYAMNIGIAFLILTGLTFVAARLWLRSINSSHEMEHTLTLLRSSEERWEFAFEGTGDGVWDCDVPSDTTVRSERWKKILGYQDNEIGDSAAEWLDRIHPDDLPVIMANVQANLNGDTDGFSHEYRILSKSNDYLWVLDRGKVVQRDANGNALRMIGTLTDISQRKQMERIKSEFISTVSHELRTPVTSIRGALGLLEAGVLGLLPPKALDLVKVANKNSQRLITLVNDILDMDKLLSGQMRLKAEPIDMAELAKQAIVANTAYAASFEVSFALSSQLPNCIASGDADRVMQVLTNLMSNAAKFSRSESVVDVRIIDAAHLVRVEVEDRGEGIPLEFQSRIFEAFSQADNADTRRHGGTGLGLNISKSFIEKMHGDIGYMTEPGKGTTFWFTLPSANS